MNAQTQALKAREAAQKTTAKPWSAEWKRLWSAAVVAANKARKANAS